MSSQRLCWRLSFFSRAADVLLIVALATPAFLVAELARADDAAGLSDPATSLETISFEEPNSGYEDIAAVPDCAPAASAASGWTFQADALFLHRSDAKPYGMLFDLATGNELLNASDLGADTAPGMRFILLRPLSEEHTLDFEYLGIDGWSSHTEFDQGNLFLIGDQSQSGPPVETASILYASRLHSAEINLRGTASGWFEPLVGFRWVRLGEAYRAHGLWDIGGGPEPYSLSYHTRNDLYGLQGGANAILLEHGPLTISTLGKAGIFFDDSKSTASFNTDVIGGFNSSERTESASFFGEIGLNATVRLTEHLALRGGYQVYWIEGVALAPNQVLSTDLANETGGIDATDGVFFHGANVGLEATW